MKAALAVVALLMSPLLAAQDNLPPPFPRTNATKLLETGHIVLWNIVWPNGQPTALHRHVYDQVGTYYARGGRTITQPDGTARRAVTEIGSLSTTRKGTTHIEEGNTDPPLRAVFIELKRDTPVSPTGAAVAAPSGWRQSFDDTRVRVWDVRAAVPTDVPLIGAPGGTVLVFLGSGKLRRTDGAGKSEDVSVEPGTMLYVAPGSREHHTWLDGALWLMIFEIK